MNTIFIGGSRHVSRLPAEVKKRLDNVVTSGHQVIVGDANGADKAVQKHLVDKRYDKVVVFCTGGTPRNNLGTWRTHHVDIPKNTKGFHFYAAKDREMAREADFGLMVWDGKSPGTVLNVMRLAIAGKIAVLFNVPEKNVVNIKTLDSWKNFISHCSRDVQMDVKQRATPEEWRLAQSNNQASFLPSLEEAGTALKSAPEPESSSEPLNSSALEEAVKVLNRALAHGDATATMNQLGIIARERGMSHVARETGLARESLYRSLDAKGNPEFGTVLKVLASIGLRLEAKSESLPTALDQDQSSFEMPGRGKPGIA
ncbi:MAG: addiction module antidote protein [Candidatus Binataceae bacterium]